MSYINLRRDPDFPTDGLKVICTSDNTGLVDTTIFIKEDLLQFGDRDGTLLIRQLKTRGEAKLRDGRKLVWDPNTGLVIKPVEPEPGWFNIIVH